MHVAEAQAFGHAGVEKRIDALATALHGKLTVHDRAELDLAYAPPYSSANDPINLAAGRALPLWVPGSPRGAHPQRARLRRRREPHRWLGEPRG